MKALAATLTCLCLHTAAFAQCDGAAALAQAPQPSCTRAATLSPVGTLSAVAAVATVAADSPAMVRTATARSEPVRAAELASRPAVGDEAAAAGSDGAHHTNSRALLMVGVALMAGIALRRWGTGRS
ncbi:hypothetical protein WG922_18355 [Ramlibacter sp. AN1015]|uniref:hypothetical protein n=1 Tax=Ramlibacter sp. AN1015 TaxID=3133428 RepID=UPI0030BC2CB5